MLKKYLFLQCRNLGDAIISTGLINSFGKSFPEISIDIFTKSAFKMIFENNPYINQIFCGSFPMGTQKNFNIKTCVDLLRQICKLRTRHYDWCLNNVGDLRENLIGRLVGSCTNISVIWSGKNAYNNMIRKGLYSLVDKVITIPQELVNVYKANSYIAEELGCCHIVRPKIFLKEKLKKQLVSGLNCEKVVAIHPCASQKSRLWDFKKWEILIHILTSRGFDVWIFCAPNEKTEMQRIFHKIIDNKKVLLHSRDIEDFFARLSCAKLLIGLDSFAVHAAYALNIPAIMLNGSNDYRIWQPPDTSVIAKEHVCDYYPCYNKPKCLGSNAKYICMNSIEVDDVINAVYKILNTS